MKNFLVMAVAAVAMVSCAQNEQELANSGLVEIRLNAEIAASVGTKAVIQEGEAVASVQFARADGETPDWASVNSITLRGDVAETSGAITFTPIPYYLSDGGKTNLVAYYPAAKTLAAGVASMEITGDEDVMYATPVSGTKTSPMTTISLSHKLTQFVFVTKRETASTTVDITGVSVVMKDANTTFDMALADGVLSNWGTPINSITPVTGGTATTTGVFAAGIMLEPDMASIDLLVSATGYAERTVTINGTDNNNFEAGKSYEITLTFKGTAIESTATIAEWLPGTPGEGDIQ